MILQAHSNQCTLKPIRKHEKDNPYTAFLTDTPIDEEDSLQTPRDDESHQYQISTPSHVVSVNTNNNSEYLSPIRHLDLSFDQSTASPSNTANSHNLLPNFSPAVEDIDDILKEDSNTIDNRIGGVAMPDTSSQRSDTESTIRSPIKKKPYNPSADLYSVQYDNNHAPDGGHTS